MMEPRKPIIALLTNNDDDVYCFRLELLQAILDEGYELLVSCPNGPKLALPELQEMHYHYDDVQIDRRGTNVIHDGKLFWHYYKLFKKYRPAVVLTYTAKPNVYGSIAANTRKIPVINNVTGFGSVLNKTGVLRAFIMGLFRTAFSHSACVMFQNSTNMKMAEETGLVKGKSILIPGSGVNTERYPLQPYPSGGDGLTGDPVIFNYIGRILHDKGVDDYFEAARRIRAKYPKTEFNVLGFVEPTESRYEGILEQLGRDGIVLYQGSQQDVKPWIARSHAIIHPSVYGEGMSNVLLENASSGRPVITTDNPGCRETVEDGITGFRYPGGDVDALTAQIERFLAMSNEQRRQMGMEGRAKVQREFERKIVIEKYLGEIRNGLQEDNPVQEC